MAKKEAPKAIRGTQDIFGEEAELFGKVADAFERVRRLCNFRRVEMPVFEKTAVFSRSLGETTDVVSKEMYSFDDRGGESLTLRPEFTAGLARAYVTNGWQQHVPLKLATHGPVFRYERPQKGRYRQFHQIDAEIIGSLDPMADVELLVMADQLLQELDIAEGVTLQLNTLGDGPSREAWRAALVEHFKAHTHELSKDSLERLDRNPLRILDSKEPQDRPVADTAPDIDAFLTDEARAFFDKVTKGLDDAGVAWTRNARLVRGLDYYRHTAFEFVTDRLGAQGTVLAGGRYDGLIGNLGGQETPAVGWAAGMERLAMLIEHHEIDAPEIILVSESDSTDAIAWQIAFALRREGMRSDVVATGSLRKRFDKARKMDGAVIMVLDDKTDDPSLIAQGRVRIGDESRARSSWIASGWNLALSDLFDVTGPTPSQLQDGLSFGLSARQPAGV